MSDSVLWITEGIPAFQALFVIKNGVIDDFAKCSTSSSTGNTADYKSTDKRSNSAT
jgi:hypothetical protein